MNALKDWLDTWPLPDGEPFPGETLRADGWEYRDLPRMTHECMDEFRRIVGEDNIRWLSFSDYGRAVRGQLFISPNGLERMREHVLRSKK